MNIICDILGCQRSSCPGLREAVLAQGDKKKLSEVGASWGKALSEVAILFEVGGGIHSLVSFSPKSSVTHLH